MKHTPGPWETSSNGIDWDVCEENGGNMIADLKDCENDEANARLIAKAPEMYEFIKAWIDFRNGKDTDPKELWLMATQAIAEIEE